MATKPISPTEVDKSSFIPDTMIEVVNELITKHFNGKNATILQDEIVTAFMSRNPDVERHQIFSEKWLDFEMIYEKEGWKVEYDKPGYNEMGKRKFVFTAKNSKE